ncbi:uncharacterized protein LOC142171855 [Nicotiana tabacum]|uniref:Uncharacterized protein LOC142171855 n=1 Tax=Nicotiana tabacum TaxID=4097 RepID=A0AC58T379_TOBAC
MYICFNALKKYWKDGLRPLIGLDGTFRKGRYKGQLLVAIGQDSMNHFYPLTLVEVDKKNARTWRWFLELLKISLDLNDGLLDVVRNALPNAHHRFCVRQIEANWQKNMEK